MGFFNEIAQAIPNEFSKLNSFSQFLKYIPVIGGALELGVKGAAAIDAGATAIADSKDDPNVSSGEAYSRGINAALAGVSGQSQDPGKFGSQGDVNNDVFNIIGSIGNFIPQGIGGGGGNGGGISFGGGAGGGFDLGSLFGGSGTVPAGGGGFSGITSAGSGFDVGGTNAFGNPLGTGGGIGFNDIGGGIPIGTEIFGSEAVGGDVSTDRFPITQVAKEIIGTKGGEKGADQGGFELDGATIDKLSEALAGLFGGEGDEGGGEGSEASKQGAAGGQLVGFPEFLPLPKVIPNNFGFVPIGPTPMFENKLRFGRR